MILLQLVELRIQKRCRGDCIVNTDCLLWEFTDQNRCIDEYDFFTSHP